MPIRERYGLWFLSEEHISYQSYGTYLTKCKEVKILPLAKKFDMNDLIIFHKSIYDLIPVSFPNYLTFFNGQTRLRSSHLDNLSLVCSLDVNSTGFGCLKRSFFYRTHLLWNELPYEIRGIESPSQFKISLISHFWDHVQRDSNINDTLEDFESYDPG